MTWRLGSRHQVKLGPWEGSWECVDCRMVVWAWPGDDEGCPGPLAPPRWFCPACSDEVVAHPFALFKDPFGDMPWVCGRCYAVANPGEALLIVAPDSDEPRSEP